MPETGLLCRMNDYNYYICHCRTEPIISTFNYTWSIDKFWDTYHFVNSLDTKPLSHQFIKLKMDIIKEEDKLKFYVLSPQYIEKPIIARCTVHVQTTKGMALSNIDIKCNFRDTMFLFDVPVALLRKEGDKYLPNNMLTVCFQFRIFHDMTQNTASKNILRARKIVKRPEILSTDQNNVVKFITNDSPLPYVPINKNLLCAKSAVFKKIFEDERNDAIYVSDITYDTLIMLSTFIEIGIAPKVNFSMENIQELLIVANEYDIDDLKKICVHLLIKKITIQNVLTLLDFAYAYDLNALKKYATAVIQVYYEKLAYTEEYSQLVQKHPDLVENREETYFMSHNTSYT